MYARVVAPSFITDMSKPRKRSDISSMVSLTSAAPAPDASYNAVRDASVVWALAATRPISAPNWPIPTAAARPAPNPPMRDRVPWSILALESAPPMLVVRVDTPLPTRLNAPEATEPTFCIVALRPWKRLPSASRGWRTTRPSPPRRSEEHTSELQSRGHLVCRLLLEKKDQYHANCASCIYSRRYR